MAAFKESGEGGKEKWNEMLIDTLNFVMHFLHFPSSSQRFLVCQIKFFILYLLYFLKGEGPKKPMPENKMVPQNTYPHGIRHHYFLSFPPLKHHHYLLDIYQEVYLEPGCTKFSYIFIQKGCGGGGGGY